MHLGFGPRHSVQSAQWLAGWRCGFGWVDGDGERLGLGLRAMFGWGLS